MEGQIRVAGIIHESIVDGPGIRFVVFCQGCPHHCEGCHNPATHPFEGGTMTPVSQIVEQVRQNPLVKGVTFSGGEPFCQCAAFATLAKELKQYGYHITAFTGYTYEELLAREDADTDRLLALVDLLIDGRFELSQLDLRLQYRGSTNQRLIDLPKTREAGHIILWQDENYPY